MLMLLTIALGACAPAAAPTGSSSPPAASTQEQRAEDQTLRIAVNGLIGNPTPQSSSVNPHQFWPLYDNLTQLDSKYAVQPSVATKWDLSADGLTWTFTVRNDMTFSNGDKLTAQDVAFSFNNTVTQKWPAITFFANVANATATNDTTVAVTMKQIDTSIPADSAALWIIPQKYFGQVGFDGFVQKPIGSGPYELAAFKNADSIDYKKRSTAHPFRHPIATEVIYQSIPDAGQVVAGLQTGALDIAALIPFNADQADKMKQTGMNVQTLPGSNLAVSIIQGQYEATNSPLKDVRVRQALNYAVDRQTIAKQIYKGYAVAIGQAGAPNTPYWDDSVGPWPYDPAKAKQLLADAGYPNGFKLNLGMDFSPSQVPSDLVVTVQSAFRDIGVQVDPISNELGVYVDKAYGRNGQVVGDLTFSSTGDINGFFTSGRTFYGCGRPLGGNQLSSRYCDPAWDKALDAALAERDDVKRGQIFHQANKISRDDVPMVFLLVTQGFVVSTSKVRGVQIANPGYYNFDSAFKVS